MAYSFRILQLILHFVVPQPENQKTGSHCSLLQTVAKAERTRGHSQIKYGLVPFSPAPGQRVTCGIASLAWSVTPVVRIHVQSLRSLCLASAQEELMWSRYKGGRYERFYWKQNRAPHY